VDYLEAEIRRLKVDVQPNYHQTAVGLLDLEADLVIVATGAVPPMPNCPEATVPRASSPGRASQRDNLRQRRRPGV
jgi:hypothetical protein